ncbi:MAG: hypothetical protein J6N45_01680 [Alphaproteobacteria bacterium]|nr:hypothetical protein [Alphaproteobacteria bacterium]
MMKKLIVMLGCVAVILCSCGKEEEQKVEETVVTPEVPAEHVVKDEDIPVEEGREFIKIVATNPSQFEREFKKFDDAQRYYFCAAFAMDVMSATKPKTASAMVSYFMGLGVAKYKVGINDDTYKAFNLGKNIFLFDQIVNVILKNKVCETIINDADDFAKKKNLKVSDLEKTGANEIEKIVKYIQKTK